MLPEERTYVIPIRVVDGEIRTLEGEPITMLRDGAIADLVVPRSGIGDAIALEAMETPQVHELLPAGISVYLGLNPHRPMGGLVEPKELGNLGLGYVGYAEVRLLEPLLLRLLRGRSSLAPCRCEVPALATDGRPLVATSLNHAFTLLSERYETHRQSHTGNVFQRCLIPRRPGAKPAWMQLRDVRLAIPGC